MTQPSDAKGSVDGTLLAGVLEVVHQLGATHQLDEALELITDAAVGVLGFGAAAINVANPDGDLRIEMVRGPVGVETLLGSVRPLSFWLTIMDSAEHWGELRFISHEHDQTLVDQFPTWVPTLAPGPEPDAWHPDDSLLAPMWDGQRLIGVLSVDAPVSGRRPTAAQCTILAVFAGQAAKVIRDAQARELAEVDRRVAEDRWRLVFENSPTGVALVSSSGLILESNDALAAMLGQSRDELVGRAFVELTYPDDVEADLARFAELLSGQRDRYELEKRYQRADAHGEVEIRHALLHVGAIRGGLGDIVTIVAQISDITERIRAEELLAFQLTHDVLTRLPNRALLEELLGNALKVHQPAGVLFCDIDRFKAINDSLGRTFGDRLLLAVARRLGALVPPEATLGRVGADQFMLVVPGLSDRDELAALGQAMVAALAWPFPTDDARVTLSMSVGAALSSPDHAAADDLIGEAEQALTRAKRHGRGLVQVYDPHHDHPFTLADLQLEQALREAIDTGQGLEIHLQPIVNVPDTTVSGAEALIRWMHPERGLLHPADFLPSAEVSGLIVPLGWHILDLAVRAAAQDRVGSPRHWIAVNVTGSQLGRGQLVDNVRQALQRHGVAPSALHLEITETALVDASPEAIREVRAVADMGVSIALDDFGTGYSSLSLLRDLPISVVKIDRSFIAPIAHDRRAAALVRSVVMMCNSLGISTVAEGVETREQLALVGALGCTLAQGYYFDPPTG